MTAPTPTTTQGGQFLLTPVGAARTFIPEDLPPELQQLRTTIQDFSEGEVLPREAEIEAKTPGIMATLLKKAGELGLLMVEIPEVYGGLGLGKVAATAVAEGATGQGSFVVSLLCHTGIGTLPLLHYGSEAQKQKYLPKLASGEMLAAYALTEANAGSDALAARTRATLSKDGKYYLLNGEKVFITNGAFADLFTVFAKVDGEKFSAFLVERSFPGVSHGPEEHKMGIRGSSTVSVILQDAKVPAENLLGEIGKGHKIAFNTLNVGRWKLGAGCAGASKYVLKLIVQYIQERQQFGKPLAAFEAMQQLLADCAIQTFLTETLVYRYAGDLDALFDTIDDAAANAGPAQARMTEELNAEASIAKVFCSEAYDAICDAAVQMHGGYGYVMEYRPERLYRDSRINRIFEGTNEINRLLIPGTLLKRMAKGGPDFFGEIQRILDWLRTGFPPVGASAPLAVWQMQVDQLKKLAIYVGAVAVNKYGPEVQERQQVLMDLAEIIIAAYVADSALARVLRLTTQGANAAIPTLMVSTYLATRLPELEVLARQTLTNIGEAKPAEYKPTHKALSRFLSHVPFDTRAAKSQIAQTILQQGGYAW
ncbi:MAG: acyl-CoA dehydrogenase family protein [Deltaproteobacteria bacterium]|nr:acyl-CoA dehydrogenase family protein [Deltaproteobacteria bacterium]